MSSEQGEYTLVEHLIELRDRLVRIAIALIITTLISLIFTPYTFRLLTAPMRTGEVVPLYSCTQTEEGLVCVERTDVQNSSEDKPVFNRPTGMIMNYVKVAFIGGLTLAMPVIVYQMMYFVLPALLAHERRYLYFIVPTATLSFLMGLSFAYFVMLPTAIPFLLNFGRDIATPLWDIGEYISLVTTLLIGVGLIFEMPLIVFVLARFGVVSHRMLMQYWKMAMLACAIVAAVVTPTGDPYNMALVALPLVFLYGLSIILAWIAYPRREPAVATAGGTDGE
jgi:sec-independent protein translocase protein TatC